SFDKAQARKPEACSKCHLGPDHPQKEVYEESKHGNVYYTNIDKMNLDADTWVVGADYNIAPTCATCHMSATTDLKVTHDVGRRISWTLRPPISKHKDDWQIKKENMQQVCASCHEDQFVENFYYQYYAVVRLYNEKFAKPATEIMNLIKKKGLLEKQASFGNKIEWVYWELWHHEGRRARHGAAMSGPDYTWWHGIYDVAKNFYFEFIPEARHYNDPEINAYIDKMLTENPMHSWLNSKPADIKADIRSGKLQETYKSLFKE
ncbi:MAG: hydroxylamine oxidoreductase, partial [Candidatus Marinimicrobia bacterium]|nr:hydroxylamine oxidoreductase [Candidatus Neomarinimicrobiota bacterium]